MYYCLPKVPECFLNILLSFAIVKDIYFAIILSNGVIPRAYFLG